MTIEVDFETLVSCAVSWKGLVESFEEEGGPCTAESGETELESFIGEVERAGRDQGLQKAQAVYFSEEAPMVSAIAPNEKQIELFLISPREREICRKLSNAFGDSYGDYPLYISHPDQFFSDSAFGLTTGIREYVYSGRAREDYDNCHIDAQTFDVIAILREQPTIDSFCYDPVWGGPVMGWISLDTRTEDVTFAQQRPEAREGVVHFALYEK